MKTDTVDTKRDVPQKDVHVIGEGTGHLMQRIEAAVETSISACYQCERCTNACPASSFMDIKPHQVIRYIQLARRKELLCSTTIWVCLSCEMCTTYCPNEVKVAESINYLRSMAAGSMVEPAEPHLAVFHRTFLDQLRRFGRVNEFWMMSSLNSNPWILKDKFKKGLLWDEIVLGIEMFKKGRLHLLPRRSRGIGKIRGIFKQGRQI